MKKVCALLCLLMICQPVLAADFRNGYFDFNKMDLVTNGEVVYAFDFGTETSPLKSGYIRVTDKFLLDPEVSFGWLRTDGLFAGERTTILAEQEKDYVGGRGEGIFRVLLGRGNYQLTFLFKDLGSRSGINLKINFEPYLENWFLPAMRTKVLVADFAAEQGVLEIRISSAKDPWILNALVITKTD